MRASLRLALWLLCFAHTAAALAQSGAKPARLAILAADPALGAASDVLTEALSSDSTVSLLERNEIDRVLSEQRLAASGLAAQNGARLGRLLGADGLVFLETAKINDNPTLTVRIVAAGPGVIVGACYDKNPPEDLQKWAADLAEMVHALAPKLSVAAGQAIPVSVLNLRSALPMREARDLERELTLLLIHCLASEPQCFVLERVQMEKLAFEKALASGSPPDFWTSSCVVDGEISASASNAVVVKLRLERPGRDAQTVQAEGSAKHLPELAELLASQLMRRMGAEQPRPAVAAGGGRAALLRGSEVGLSGRLAGGIAGRGGVQPDSGLCLSGPPGTPAQPLCFQDDPGERTFPGQISPRRGG